MTTDEITFLISGVAIGFYLALLVHVGGQILDDRRALKRLDAARNRAEA